MLINEKLTHIHPSAVAIFVPGFGDEFTQGNVIIAKTVENGEEDISSINISLTVPLFMTISLYLMFFVLNDPLTCPFDAI